jgi:hypothetical protein
MLGRTRGLDLAAKHALLNAVQGAGRLLMAETEDGLRLDVERLQEFAIANDCWQDSYAGLNVGQQRMNVGNRARAKLKQGVKLVWPEWGLEPMTIFQSVGRRHPLTINGRPCDVQECFVTGGRFGERVVVRRWRDTGETELRSDGKSSALDLRGRERNTDMGSEIRQRSMRVEWPREAEPLKIAAPGRSWVANPAEELLPFLMR